MPCARCAMLTTKGLAAIASFARRMFPPFFAQVLSSENRCGCTRTMRFCAKLERSQSLRRGAIIPAGTSLRCSGGGSRANGAEPFARVRQREIRSANVSDFRKRARLKKAQKPTFVRIFWSGGENIRFAKMASPARFTRASCARFAAAQRNRRGYHRLWLIYLSKLCPKEHG
jgi:hypothetical protein